MNDKITFRLGTLAEALHARTATTGERASDYIRRLVAEDLGRPTPEMKCGNPEGFAAINKRRKQAKKRKAKRK